MDKRLRRNEICIIGLPRCDFAFSSTRTCFIGYGFAQSTLEMTILRNLLEKRGIEAVEAAGLLAPAQNAFCAKICSKIIVSQFCIILLNNDIKHDQEVPNANVNMEYGLMLGFNKYVIPFQRKTQELPFNVAGLDTIKYSNESFEREAANAIDGAIAATIQDSTPTISPDQVLEAFLLSNQLLIVPLTTDGDRVLFQLGQPLGFNLLMTFGGMHYRYFGNFTALRPETVLWRIRTLENIIKERLTSLPERIKLGMTTPEAKVTLEMIFGGLKNLLLVTSDDDRQTIEDTLQREPTHWPVQVLSLNDIGSALQNIR